LIFFERTIRGKDFAHRTAFYFAPPWRGNLN